ncbi:MAG TPA: carbohydrate ABC transporter permease [Chloroflexota bacterium]|jgi:ABC-type glycerol-3-phosphate transport system permease component|nr:carbohydrate ABC transporter permease [Chloroflexota bacterium]
MAGLTLARPAGRTIRSERAQAARLGRWLVLYLLVALGSLVSIFPFVWTVLSSGKEVSELYRYPPTLWPSTPRFLENYREIWRLVPFGRWLVNTAEVTGLSLVGTVLSATVVAYSFARFRYPGRDLAFFVTLGTLMLPVEVTLIPTYLLFRNLGWLDTYLPLVIPSWLGGGAFNIFLMRQFIMSIPYDLDEAARIDGAGSFRVLWQILAPLCKPALATMATLGFISHWNSFLGPLIFLNSPEKYLVAVGLRYFQSGAAQGSAVALPQDHLLMGAALMVALPCLLLFFLAQKYFVQGIVMSGIKG